MESSFGNGISLCIPTKLCKYIQSALLQGITHCSNLGPKFCQFLSICFNSIKLLELLWVKQTIVKSGNQEKIWMALEFLFLLIFWSLAEMAEGLLVIYTFFSIQWIGWILIYVSKNSPSSFRCCACWLCGLTQGETIQAASRFR